MFCTPRSGSDFNSRRVKTSYYYFLSCSVCWIRLRKKKHWKQLTRIVKLGVVEFIVLKPLFLKKKKKKDPAFLGKAECQGAPRTLSGRAAFRCRGWSRPWAAGTGDPPGQRAFGQPGTLWGWWGHGDAAVTKAIAWAPKVLTCAECEAVRPPTYRYFVREN